MSLYGETANKHPQFFSRQYSKIAHNPMFSKIKLIIKMIGWFFVEIFELITGKRKLMQEYDPEDDPEILDEAVSEENEQ